MNNYRDDRRNAYMRRAGVDLRIQSLRDEVTDPTAGAPKTRLASISTAGVPTNTNRRLDKIACGCFSVSPEDPESHRCAARPRIACGGVHL